MLGQPHRVGIWLNQFIRYECQLCRLDLVKSYNHVLCHACHQSIEWLPKPSTVFLDNGQKLTINAMVKYQSPVSNLIKRYKLTHDISVLPVLINLLQQIPCPAIDQTNTVILPMPTTKKRLIERGFDPTLTLAKYLSAHWHIGLWQKVQIRETEKKQKVLTKIERLSNMRNVFKLEQNLPVKNVILFDDISTTGASLQSLANTIIAHSNDNSVSISAYCVAH